jgi:flagellar hook-basal body complex protein FliE
MGDTKMIALDKAAGVAMGLANPTGAKAAPTANSPAPFAGVFNSMMRQSEQLGKSAQESVSGLLNGTGVEVHDAVIASQKASVAFELALQVRNKAVAAYQQMMGMQF